MPNATNFLHYVFTNAKAALAPLNTRTKRRVSRGSGHCPDLDHDILEKQMNYSPVHACVYEESINLSTAGIFFIIKLLDSN